MYIYIVTKLQELRYRIRRARACPHRTPFLISYQLQEQAMVGTARMFIEYIRNCGQILNSLTPTTDELLVISNNLEVMEEQEEFLSENDTYDGRYLVNTVSRGCE